MSSVDAFLLAIAAVFVIGVVGEIFFERTQVPDVIWLIVTGLLVGPILGLVAREPLLEIAPYFGAVTLVVVLFNGGTTLRVKDLLVTAPRASALALLGFLLALIGVALLSMLGAAVGLFPEGWGWLHGLMLGSILGGSSSVIIMPAMQRAGLDPKVASLVNLESALTDVLCVVGTGALIQVAVSGEAGAGGAAAALGSAP